MAECIPDERGKSRFAVEQRKFGVKLAAAERAQVYSPQGGAPLRQNVRVQLSKTRCRVGNSKMFGDSRKAREGAIGDKAKAAGGLHVRRGRPESASSVGRVPCNTSFD